MKYCKDRVRLSIFNLMLQNVILKCNRTVKSFYFRLREVSLYLLIFVFFLLYCIIFSYFIFDFRPGVVVVFWLVQFPGHLVAYSSCREVFYWWWLDNSRKFVFLVTGVSILWVLFPSAILSCRRVFVPVLFCFLCCCFFNLQRIPCGPS